MKNLSTEERKKLIKKVSKAINKKYDKAFRMISDN